MGDFDVVAAEDIASTVEQPELTGELQTAGHRPVGDVPTEWVVVVSVDAHCAR